MDDAPLNEGVPSNFRGVIPACQTSSLVKYLEYCPGRDRFVYTRLHDLGQAGGFLVIGLFGNPTNWFGADGTGTPPLSALIPDLHRILDQHTGLQLLIDYSFEAGLGQAFFSGVDAFIGDLRIDPSRVVAVVTNQGIEDRHARYLRTQNRTATESFRTIGLDFWLMYSGIEFERKHWYGHQEALVRDAEVDASHHAHRSRKFLSFNRRPRWHRYLLGMMIEQFGLRADGLVSMSSPSYRGDWASEDGSIDTYGALMAPEAWDAIRGERDRLMQSLPWSLDINMDDNSGQPESYLYGTQSRDLFLNSYCQIITESYMEGERDDVFITEKTCRSLANLQPFLVFGHAQTLKRLRQYGFADCSIFDSSYDDMTDIGHRLTALHRNVSRLNSLPFRDLHEGYFDNLEALRHNRARLFEMPGILAARLASRLQAELSVR
jgi:hypothetical protein